MFAILRWQKMMKPSRFNSARMRRSIDASYHVNQSIVAIRRPADWRARDSLMRTTCSEMCIGLLGHRFGMSRAFCQMAVYPSGMPEDDRAAPCQPRAEWVHRR